VIFVCLGRYLSAELLLGLALQRGSLRFLLEWVKMALEASVAGDKEALIPSSSFLEWLDQMHASTQKSQHQLQIDASGFTPLYQAALYLMGQVVPTRLRVAQVAETVFYLQLVTLACEHMHFCACSEGRAEPSTLIDDSKQSNNTTTATVPEATASKHCDVYVWGSNSSHQLAEVSPEKIFIPKLAKAFSDVQQVIYSEN
jgi:E3 ubiquitin-protein ligase HERC1